ncbi:hypothetical protein F5Y08DRAFT_223783 [Xylaria arbuscula]|nr:hypothetical protein F5Y08DRAFT_223783 [Xylaria arbuscula]
MPGHSFHSLTDNRARATRENRPLLCVIRLIQLFLQLSYAVQSTPKALLSKGAQGVEYASGRSSQLENISAALTGNYCMYVMKGFSRAEMQVGGAMAGSYS